MIPRKNRPDRQLTPNKQQTAVRNLRAAFVMLENRKVLSFEANFKR